MKHLMCIAGLVAVMIVIILILPTPGSQSGAPSSENQSGGETPTAFIDVRVFDGHQVYDSASLIIQDGRVIDLGADIPIPDDADVIDGQGKTLIPGLIDSHVHAWGAARADALRFGVTTMLDMFTSPQLLSEARTQRESLAPTEQADLYSAGNLATVEGGHGTQFGLPVPTLNQPDEAERWVADRIVEGSDYIKIVIEDGSDWGRTMATLDAATVAALTDAAHAQELMAVAHVSDLEGAEIALQAGVDGLVHLFADQPIPADWLERAVEAGLFVVPTATVLAGAYGQSGANQLMQHPVLSSRLSTGQKQSLTASFPGNDLRKARWSLVLDNLAALHEAGIKILAGSDAPNPSTAHGISMQHELKLLMTAGLSPIEALASATSVPANAFGLQHRGCLRPGCRADLVLLSGNPFANPEAFANIAGVWKNGHAVEITLEPQPAAVTSPPPENIEPRDLLTDTNRWMVSTDQFMGGNSVAEQTWDDQGLRIRGELRNGTAFPYTGSMWMTSDTPMQAANLTGYTEMTLQVSSQQARYRVMLFSGKQANSMPVMRDFSAEQMAEGVTLNLGELAGLDMSRLRAIGIFAADQSGAFEFIVEQARLDLEASE